jgi:hypothetical protein
MFFRSKRFLRESAFVSLVERMALLRGENFMVISKKHTCVCDKMVLTKVKIKNPFRAKIWLSLIC